MTCRSVSTVRVRFAPDVSIRPRVAALVAAISEVPNVTEVRGRMTPDEFGAGAEVRVSYAIEAPQPDHAATRERVALAVHDLREGE